MPQLSLHVGHLLYCFAGINKPIGVEWNPNKSYMMSFQGKCDSYGKPPEGSKTEARAIRACEHINKELCTLLTVIRFLGVRDPITNQLTVTFGKMFSYYESMSNKVVGLLLRARRWGLVEFPGEMLYQRQDDHVVIKLLIDESRIPPSKMFKTNSVDPRMETKTTVSSSDSTLAGEIR